MKKLKLNQLKVNPEKVLKESELGNIRGAKDLGGTGKTLYNCFCKAETELHTVHADSIKEAEQIADAYCGNASTCC